MLPLKMSITLEQLLHSHIIVVTFRAKFINKYAAIRCPAHAIHHIPTQANANPLTKINVRNTNGEAKPPNNFNNTTALK